MESPVLVHARRGGVVESLHRGAVAVVDAEGGLVLGLGDVERPVFGRSTLKAFQAMPLLESGAADRFGLEPADLALACASHNGEPRHAAAAAGMLARIGLDETALGCGAHWPMSERASRALAAEGRRPSCLHNNCSGKHSGFLCAAVALGAPVETYLEPGHAVQAAVRDALSAGCGLDIGRVPAGVDGCSAPVYAPPLRALAMAFARLGTGHGFGPERAAAAARLRAAVAANPWAVGGEERFDTVVMSALGARAFLKMGAEGVHVAALPELGLGVALKIDDGASRAAEVAMAALLLRLLPLSEAERAVLEPAARPVLRNVTGRDVGALEPAEALG